MGLAFGLVMTVVGLTATLGTLSQRCSTPMQRRRSQDAAATAEFLRYLQLILAQHVFSCFVSLCLLFSLGIVIIVRCHCTTLPTTSR